MNENDLRQAYLTGFTTKCAEYGVDPDAVAALVFEKDAQFGAMWNKAKQLGSNAVEAAKLKGQRVMGNVAEGALNAATNVGQAARNVGSNIANTGKNVAQGVANVATTGAKAVQQGYQGAVQAGREVGQGIQATGQEIAGGVRNVANVYGQGAQNVAAGRGAALPVPQSQPMTNQVAGIQR